MSDAGMPGISDPGAGLVRYCQENNLPYDVLPGANAVLLAYVASGFTETNFSFFGFLPHKGKERDNALQEILNHPLNVILYESPHRLEKLMSELLLHVPTRLMFAIKEATKKHEKKFKGTVQEVFEKMKESNLKGEWAIVLQASPSPSAGVIGLDDILQLSLPPKQKAKLLSKLTGASVKEWYDKLTL